MSMFQYGMCSFFIEQRMEEKAMSHNYKRNTAYRKLLAKLENKWLVPGEKTPIARSDLLNIKWCLEKAIPKLVYEHTTDWDWCYCSTCYAILDREYMRYCDCCGQSLSWYGTTKYRVSITYAEAQNRRNNND